MLTNTTEIGTATLPRRRLTIPAPTDVSPSAPRRPPRFPALAQFASAARRVPRAPIPVAFALAVLAVLAVLATVAPEQAVAQSEITLVSNTGQGNDENATGTRDRAQAFTTGSNSGGYTLSSVDLISEDSAGDDATVSVCTVDGSGYPTTTCTALTAPGSYVAGTLTFTASPSMTLASTTTYSVLIGTPGGDPLGLDSTTSDGEDTGGAAGWSLDNSYDFKNSSNVWGTITNGQSFRVTIKGTIVSSTNNPPTVANAIPDQSATAGTAFSYAFPANTFSDADTGDMLSYTATKADDTALPTWLAFAAGTRTFSGTPQAAGTVAVKVTARDGNGGSVSDTFDITVAADPNAHCNALDTSELWCGTLTVGVSRGVAYGYNADLFFGSVAPLTFTHGGATITVDGLFYVGIRLQFTMSSALGAGDFSLEIGTGGAKRSFAMNNPGIEADFDNHGLSWSANETVPVKLLLVNTPATGAPAITGTAQVGQTLTATLGDIADVDGLPDPFLTDANTSFQWIRVATDNSETDISGAMAGAYTLVADDQGTTIKVKVSFTGNNGFAETRTSAATAAVSAVAAAVVPADWSLKPTAVAAGAKFRLLFLSSTKRNATSTDIADYNTFIQGRAAAGHTDIQDYSAGFRVVGCTAAVDARDNTKTTYTTTDKGVPIYWLNGAKAADQYEDFYDGSWDDEANDKNESGTNGPDTSQNNNLPLTGCSHDGTELTTFGASRALGASQVSVGRPNSSGSGNGPLFASALVGAVLSRPLYGLSAVFQVAAAVVVPNNPPTVANAIPDQTATAGTAFSYVFPDTTFSDADTSDTLTYTATKADDTALPTWLGFAASTRTFSGTPQAADIATVAVKVTARDGNGGSVSDTFDITVAADTTPPTLISAMVFETGVFIQLQFSENMLQSNVPPNTTFTVTAAGSAVTVYTVQPAVALLNAFWIRVGPTIHQGQAVVVTYTDPTAGDDDHSAFQDIAGNDVATFTTGMDSVPAVTNNSTFTNTPATGAPTITGTPTVGQTLTATVGDIADVDGLPDPFLTDANTSFQWIRVATDNSETDISGAMAGAYTLVADDLGTTVKVRVSFTDDASNDETLTSAATAAVSAARDAALRECGPGCRVALTFPRGGAYAVDQDADGTAKAPVQAALSECGSRAGSIPGAAP